MSPIEIYDFTNLAKKIIDIIDMEKDQNQSALYIKNLKLEPIEITFTFRSSPGEKVPSNT